MSDLIFTPPGFVWTYLATWQAVEVWFQPELIACDPGDPPPPPPREPSSDPLAQIIAGGLETEGTLSWRERVQAERAEPYRLRAANRLRGALYEGKLVAFYSSLSGRLQNVDAEFWASRLADGVIECGWYDPFPGATTPRGRTNAERLYVEEGALAALLGNKGNKTDGPQETSDAAAEKRRISEKSKACRAAFDHLYPGGVPAEDILSNSRVCTEVTDYIRVNMPEHKGVGDYAIKAEAGRIQRKQRPKR